MATATSASLYTLVLTSVWLNGSTDLENFFQSKLCPRSKWYGVWFSDQNLRRAKKGKVKVSPIAIAINTLTSQPRDRARDPQENFNRRGPPGPRRYRARDPSKNKAERVFTASSFFFHKDKKKLTGG